MKIIKFLFKVALAMILIFFVLAFFGEKNYQVKRSIVINGSAQQVWEQVSNYSNWPNWSPWQENDPTVTNQFFGVPGTTEHSMSWIGDKDLSGTGNMKITSIDPNKSLDYLLTFEVPFAMHSDGGMTLTEKNGETILTWFDKGDIPFIMRPFMVFMDLEGQIAPDFERGLFKIDSLVRLQKVNQILK